MKKSDKRQDDKIHDNSRRAAARKHVGGVTVSNITALKQFALIARLATMVDVSASGILLLVDRKDLIPKSLRDNLSLDAIEGEHIMIRIAEMDLDIDGVISRTRHVGKGIFELALDFTDEAPEYWRECLVDLLPSPGELTDN